VIRIEPIREPLPGSPTVRWLVLLVALGGGGAGLSSLGIRGSEPDNGASCLHIVERLSAVEVQVTAANETLQLLLQRELDK